MERDEIVEKIKKMLIERLNLPVTPDEINEQTQIFGEEEGSLGLDSVDGLEIVVGLGNEFGVTLTEDEGPEALKTIGTLTDFVIKNIE